MPNKIVRSDLVGHVFAEIGDKLASTTSFQHSDFLIFDDTLNQIRKPASEAECATFLGVAKCDVVDGKLRPVYQGTDVDAVVAGGGIPGPCYGVEVKCVVKTGETIAIGDLVYADPATGARAIASTGTKPIGVAQQAITGAAAGAEIIVKIGHRFPGDVLVGV